MMYVPTPEAERVLHEVCDWARWGDVNKRFPGTQPVSLRRKDLSALRKRADDYAVCEKTDGERCFFYATGSAAFFIDRKGAAQKVIIPPLKTRGALGNADAQATLLDGEWVGDAFLIFDAVAVQGRDVSHLPLDQRLSYALDFILCNKDSPLRLSMKDFFSLKHLEFVWREICPRLPHECDGLIFTPISEPYKAGTSDTLFKWKPGDYNTVDFKLEPITANNKVHVKLLVLNEFELELYGWLASSEEPLSGITECKWNPSVDTYILNEDRWETGGWVIFRQREDKDCPNSILTASRVQETISEALQFENVLSALNL
eukprot:GEMP01045096.1.p1 GENE.GEMP01045096.1~~GEMP01045096.1.p1  ORF type:complete len:316 (+),score=77.92 GEMP01045096.1:26-973(+)